MDACFSCVCCPYGQLQLCVALTVLDRLQSYIMMNSSLLCYFKQIQFEKCAYIYDASLLADMFVITVATYKGHTMVENNTCVVYTADYLYYYPRIKMCPFKGSRWLVLMEPE